MDDIANASALTEEDTNPALSEDSSSQEWENPPREKTEIDYKKRYSASSEEARRLHKENTEAVATLYERVEEDNTYLLKLAETRPQLAEKIAKKFIDPDTGRPMSLERAVKRIKDWQEKSSTSTPQSEEEDMIEKIAKRASQRAESEARKKEVKTVVNNFLKEMDEEQAEEVVNRYQKLADGRDLDPETALEYLEMAEAYTSKRKKTESTKDAGFNAYHSTGALGRAYGEAPPKLSRASQSADNQLFGK